MPDTIRIEVPAELLKRGRVALSDAGSNDEEHDVLVELLVLLEASANEAALTEVVRTSNGYDPRWIDAINRVLSDRDSDVRITDIDDQVWEAFLGPLVDFFEDHRATVTSEPQRR